MINHFFLQFVKVHIDMSPSLVISLLGFSQFLQNSSESQLLNYYDSLHNAPNDHSLQQLCIVFPHSAILHTSIYCLRNLNVCSKNNCNCICAINGRL